jgi:programmed cell death 8 (apoptosis-inducing factor)
MGKVLPEYLSEWTTKKVQGEGVEVIPESFVTGVKLDAGNLLLTLNNGKQVRVLHIVRRKFTTLNINIVEMQLCV